MKTILLVDDDEWYRDVLSRVLVKKGYSVLEAGSGKSGIKFLQQKDLSINVVLLDYFLQDMTGIDFLNHLEQFEKPPIIVLTGYDDMEIRGEILARGAELCLRKTISQENLIAIIQWMMIRQDVPLEIQPHS
ncbi:MAG: response regulator [Candidatus Omnitrophica bacterium]|nr:response regulator [Candidatus Omnitrophota bacterium]